MSDQNNDQDRNYGGDRRSRDRRKSDRRQGGRRAPLPPWRRPIAFVAYGLIAGLVLVFVLGGGDDEPEDNTIAAAMGEDTVPAVLEIQPGTPSREASTIAQFESLVAEGEAAVGETVQTELYCSSIMPVTMREVDQADPRLVQLADAENRVPAAECRWGREARSSDFLLVVPAQLAADFARAPEVELNFVRRRRVPATVLWLGRSDALSVRIAGILTGIRTPDR